MPSVRPIVLPEDCQRVLVVLLSPLASITASVSVTVVKVVVNNACRMSVAFAGGRRRFTVKGQRLAPSSLKQSKEE